MYCTTIYYKKIIQNPDSLEMDSKTGLVLKIPDSVSWRIFLREQGKITKEDIDQMAVDDIPSEWRLACQMIVRDEDILVQY